MLEIELPGGELYDEIKEEFIELKRKTIQLEHSLISISKWESKWKKPFLDENLKLTTEQFIDYILCMCVTKNVSEFDLKYLSNDTMDKISEYMKELRTATWFNENDKRVSHDVVTSEILYYQMFKLGIPIECEKWHLSRLITLIRIYSAKDSNTKKMSRKEVMAHNRALNEARKKKYGTKG